MITSLLPGVLLPGGPLHSPLPLPRRSTPAGARSCGRWAWSPPSAPPASCSGAGLGRAGGARFRGVWARSGTALQMRDMPATQLSSGDSAAAAPPALAHTRRLSPCPRSVIVAWSTFDYEDADLDVMGHPLLNIIYYRWVGAAGAASACSPACFPDASTALNLLVGPNLLPACTPPPQSSPAAARRSSPRRWCCTSCASCRPSARSRATSRSRSSERKRPGPRKHSRPLLRLVNEPLQAGRPHAAPVVFSACADVQAIVCAVRMHRTALACMRPAC